MIGLGTIVNVGTVLIGTTIGILLKNGLPKRFEKTVMQGRMNRAINVMPP